MTADEASLLVVAGEASGDLHGARLLEALTRRHPGLAPFGLGGPELAKAGLDCVASSDEIAVVGITEVIRILPRARQIFRMLVDAVVQRGTRVAVLIDAPDFNLRLAKALKRRGVRIVYYISPQVWAWRKRRVHAIRRLVDRMLVLFPFEVDFYRAYDVEAVHVGHPLIDEVPQGTSAWDRLAGDQVPEPIRISLLPGSRNSEVRSLLPSLLSTVALIADRVPVAVSLIRAPGIARGDLERALASCPVAVEVTEAADRFDTLGASHLAICASGTATLEVGLIGTPMIVVYRLARWSYVLAKLLVKLPSFSLVNLVLGAQVVPERLQAESEPSRVADEAVTLVHDRARIDTMRSSLATLRDKLGAGGASERAAAEVAQVLEAAS